VTSNVSLGSVLVVMRCSTCASAKRSCGEQACCRCDGPIPIAGQRYVLLGPCQPTSLKVATAPALGVAGLPDEI
jgi:hypothetical protein